MLRALPYIILAVLAYLTLVYLHNYRPEIWTHLLIQFDVLDLTPEAKEEHTRETAISLLPIHYEEKQVLINRTVFLGATQEMVRLALGDPKKYFPPSFSKNEQGEIVKSIYYVYYLPGAIRPTILVFQEDKDDKLYKLVSAYKGSVLEWGN